MPLFPLVTVLLQATPAVPSIPTGLEWMPVLSFLVPAVLLIVLVYIGRKTTV